jgi:hypothetical protein
MFTFQEEIITKKKEDNLMNNIFGLFIGMLSFAPKVQVTEIKLVSKCVKECPKTHNGKDVIVNLADRKCQ